MSAQMAGSGRRNVLVFNPGRASLKFDVVASGPPEPNLVRGEKLLSGVVQPMGENAKLSLLNCRKTAFEETLPVEDHGAAAKEILARIDSWLAAPNGIASTREIHLVGHRVVHGADRYTAPVPIDDRVIGVIEELRGLAPLHNAAALSVIRASRAAFSRRIPQIAVFDTAFHRTIPDRARFYAIPWDLTRRYGIERYGFHGTSHRYLMLRYAELTGTPVAQT
ncbi:MAG: acetate kinase, partial [Bryobacteraceae bacterium]